MIRSLVFAALASSLAVPAAAYAAANVYKCPGPSGSTVYSQFPCAKKAPDVDATATVKPAAQIAGSATSSADIDGECAARTRTINDRFSNAAADATAEIRRLREQMSLTGGYSADKPDNGLRAELTAAEDRLDAAGRAQRRDLVELRKDCDERRSAQHKAQSGVDAAGIAAK
jgi:inorganic triphosphatase YgiF